jgi:hypothetical protein
MMETLTLFLLRILPIPFEAYELLSQHRDRNISVLLGRLYTSLVMHWFCCDINLLEIAQVELGVGLHRMTTPSPLGVMPDNTT